MGFAITKFVVPWLILGALRHYRAVDAGGIETKVDFKGSLRPRRHGGRQAWLDRSSRLLLLCYLVPVVEPAYRASCTLVERIGSDGTFKDCRGGGFWDIWPECGMATPEVGFAFSSARSAVLCTKRGNCCLQCRNGYRVTLFESEAKCGGHTLTDDTSPWPVDLGFQVRIW